MSEEGVARLGLVVRPAGPIGGRVLGRLSPRSGVGPLRVLAPGGGTTTTDVKAGPLCIGVGEAEVSG